MRQDEGFRDISHKWFPGFNELPFFRRLDLFNYCNIFIGKMFKLDHIDDFHLVKGFEDVDSRYLFRVRDTVAIGGLVLNNLNFLSYQ